MLVDYGLRRKNIVLGIGRICGRPGRVYPSIHRSKAKTPMPRVIGLTGGIATGKSTVSSAWRAAGVPVIDADAIAREVVKPGRPALRLIRWRFGAQVLRPDGTLDRAALGRLIFADPVKRRALNRIMHPFIIAAMVSKLVYALVVRFHPVVVLDTPLLFESGTLVPLCNSTVVVYCSPELQINRLLARSKKEQLPGAEPLSEQEAKDRIASQMPLSVKVARATYVLDNSASIEAIQESAVELLDEFRPSPAGEVCFRVLVLAVVGRVSWGICRTLFRRERR
jgi:dephospho-CoA kinase